MEARSDHSKNAQSFQTLVSCPLSSSLSSLSSSSRTLPSNQDFHFFNNFDNFRLPINQIANTSDSLLQFIGSSSNNWGPNNAINFPNNIESMADGEAYSWLTDTNEGILEQVDVSVDEFQMIREKEEEMGRVIGSDLDNNGYKLVQGKKKKKGDGGLVRDSVYESPTKMEGGSSGSPGVKMKKGALAQVTTGKAKVSFHIPTIRKPQEEYNILVNNSNQPFVHVWLQKSEDGLRFVHPMEKLSVMDFVDKDIMDIEPIKPPSIESTPFTLVEKVKDLKELATKLRIVDEFAVDLEHNQYRSFQGLTCLMQISTRTEDFIVDTLKLRIHIGPYLREIFKDPSKKKVMHGADRDILWLQRDFGIYLCNLFDTGQASRVLKSERNSLEHLLQHYCGVTANKEYQNADWRLRPLPDEMLRYAREDTHYLLYIYDLMRTKLLSMPKEPEHFHSPLVEVYKQSSDVCMQLYEKELLMENSYLHIYGLQGAGFNAEQLAIVAALCEWRDYIARAEDESTGYILPNKVLLEIAKQMPVTVSKLCRLLKSKHPYVEQNIGAVATIIKHSMQNAVAFEAAAQQLRMGRVPNASGEHVAVTEGAGTLPPETPTDSKITNDRTKIIDGSMGGPAHLASPRHKAELLKFGSCISGPDMVKEQTRFPFEPDMNGMSISARESLAFSGQRGESNAWPVIPPSAKMTTGSNVLVLKKPSRGLGELMGNATAKKKFNIDKIEKEEGKLEQIRSSVNLSFHSFSGIEEQPKLATKEPTRLLEVPRPDVPLTMEATESTSENIIMLEDKSNKNKSIDGNSSSPEDETLSLSELSISFQQGTQTINDENRNVVKANKSKESIDVRQMKPFDYEAAMKEVKFGEESTGEETGSHSNSAGKKKSSAGSRLQFDDGTKQFPQARQRAAFPASGNRSATFR
ncbi:RRP6-like 2 [Hibiscus trionum]|nr:RRP6-like 2 [Hibiscus trionum]